MPGIKGRGIRALYKDPALIAAAEQATASLTSNWAAGVVRRACSESAATLTAYAHESYDVRARKLGKPPSADEVAQMLFGLARYAMLAPPEDKFAGLDDYTVPSLPRRTPQGGRPVAKLRRQRKAA